MQNLPGQQILAQWSMSQADAATGTLGRALSGGVNTSRIIPLIKPGTEYTAAHAARRPLRQALPAARFAKAASDG